jgi:hypothetical protein
MITQLKGGCRCGAVRYRIVGKPVLVCGCCCKDCARITGNPGTIWVGIHGPMIEFTDALPVFRETAPFSERGHCAICEVPLTFRRIRGEAEVDPLFYVTAESLDDPTQVKPSEIVYYDQRPAGFEAEPGIPLHPGPSPEYGSRKRHGKLH